MVSFTAKCNPRHTLLTSLLDITYDSGPTVIDRYLNEEERERFMKPGYRFRIVK